MEPVRDFTKGLGFGWEADSAARKNKELIQGKSYLLASGPQVVQILSLSNQSAFLEKSLPSSPLKSSLKIARQLSPLSLVVCPSLAVVKNGQYPAAAKALNVYLSKMGISLPEKLGKSSTSALNFLAEHTGTMTNVVMTVHNVAFFFAGVNPLFAGATLIPLAYKTLEDKGWIHRKVSLEIERHMPILSTASNLTGNNLILKTFSAFYILNFFPTVAHFCQRKVEKTAKSMLKLEGPSLEEIEGPLSPDKTPSYERILHILMQEEESRLSINPAHCSKAVERRVVLNKNKAFPKFIELVNLIDWTKKYTLLRSAFRDDNRFMGLLKDEFPDQMDIFDNFDSYVVELAAKTGISKEEYLAEKLKTQMKYLVDVLMEKITPPGTKRDLDEALNNYPQILTHLLTLTEPSQRVELEDALVKIGVAAEYCALQLKITSKDILDGILFGHLDPQTGYETRLQQALEFERKQIMEVIYSTLMKEIASSLPEEAHILDLYRPNFALGVIPLSKFEREAVGFGELYNWSSPLFRHLRGKMYSTYQHRLDDILKSEGEIYFVNYMGGAIELNPSLNSNQKELLKNVLIGVYPDLDGLTELEQAFIKKMSSLRSEDVQKRFHHLLFYMLGVENYDSSGDEWTYLTDEDLSVSEGESKISLIADEAPMLISSDEEEFEHLSTEELDDWTVVSDEEDINTSNSNTKKITMIKDDES